MKIYYLLFVFTILSCSKSKEITPIKVVALQPYIGFSSANVDSLKKTISEFYNVKVIILSEINLAESAFVNTKSPRYRADSIILIQKRNRPNSIDFIIGLTDKDVSVTKKNKDGSIKKPEWKYNDFGVMGLAYCPGKSAVISKFRLKNENKSLELERLKKVVIHEFGHNLGLPHCTNNNCVMTSAAEKISTIDNEKMELCKNCKAILK